MSSLRLGNALQSVSAQLSNFSHAITTGKLGTSSDARIFATSKRGELNEWKQQLTSPHKDKKKAAVKSVIAAMTMGKDVSSLFPEVVNCMQTTNLELKKLVYLYVINFARTRPELAILAVNTFRKDTMDTNPLVRALAIRTMASIRLKQMTEYVVEPLNRLCRDPDPYVRKTAVIAVGKLYDTSPEAAKGHGFVDLLQEMMNDSNPVVVANVIATLDEISDLADTDYLEYTSEVVSKLLLALSDCSEWGQIIILDSLAQRYECQTQSEAEMMTERLISRLNHANPGVVISCARLLFKLLDAIGNDALQTSTIQKKILPPLFSLLASESPELQFVILRNLLLVAQRFPGLLTNECRLFFVKFNDPYYIKFEKLELLTRCVSPENVDLLIPELCEYAAEVDVEFVKRSIRCLGRLALVHESVIEKVMKRLTELLETRTSFIVEEVVIVLRDLFRKYPNRYEGVLANLVQPVPVMDDPESRAAFIWMLGEYCDTVPGADTIIKHYVSTFLEEPSVVQYQILTASVKLFLKFPNNNQQIVMNVLKLATEEADSPDLRDRSFLYWRLLTQDANVAQQVICSRKPPIKVQIFNIPTDLLDVLMKNFGLLASIYHEDPSLFIGRLRDKKIDVVALDQEDDSDDENKMIEDTGEIKKRMDGLIDETSEESRGVGKSSSSEEESQKSEASNESSSSSDEGESTSAPPPTTLKRPIPPRLMLMPLSNGLQIEGCTTRVNNSAALLLRIINRSGQTIGPYKLTLEPNSFGFQASGPILERTETLPNKHSDIPIRLVPDVNPSQQPPSHPMILRAQLSAPQCGPVVFNVPFDLINAFVEKPALSKEGYRDHWIRMTEAKQIQTWAASNTGKPVTKVAAVSALDLHNIKEVTEIAGTNYVKVYMSGVTTNNLLLLMELSLQHNGPGVCLTMRADVPALFGGVTAAVCTLLNCTPTRTANKTTPSSISTTPSPSLL
eukprot:Blabericola_migrator_1__10906@NODE_62_length_15736_cov_138_574510_g56_i0_p2_GENE_NODE_62_length_15736_cov_138_574510_g56_i0NODE_62_length_15736_cov_138_574510_g56_i0_p2_ORF_typecomplete_len962_score214_05Adaptin_N/PF01602_20/3_8e141Cnd1/PF12717_7/7e03Cnd1/PF12717_7/3_5e21Cnd1/PF12717_7/9_5Cnd1/PF12717_7/2_5HEAT_2/PF13646_6/2_9e06HEAT_2/PF13646_6/9_5e07HEAT_2/PF13646_6/14HEAT_2/PF13646_6/2_3e02HEAT_2/PF13646_6/1_6e03CLASP_N/PF12348_8/0_029CLASP_N/PF12348_8/0_0011CLASP_N/PF12348_8/32HEAT/PF02985_2